MYVNSLDLRTASFSAQPHAVMLEAVCLINNAKHTGGQTADNSAEESHVIFGAIPMPHLYAFDQCEQHFSLTISQRIR